MKKISQIWNMIKLGNFISKKSKVNFIVASYKNTSDAKVAYKDFIGLPPPHLINPIIKI